MTSLRSITCICTFLMLGNALPVAAERYIPNMESRLEALEGKIERLQRQPVNGASSSSSLSSLQVEIAAMQEELRSLRGGVEEARFAADQLQREMKLNNEDHEYRFKALEEKLGGGATANAFGDDPASAATEGTPAPSATPPSEPTVTAPSPAAFATTTPPVTPQNTIATTASTTPPAPVPTPPPAETAENAGSSEHYNFAVGLIKEKRFDRARDSFKKFIETYPSHRLIGNAYYWLGETYYVQSNFMEAAQSFKQGFESNADGIKAADNLYKLAKSLLNLNKQKEACLVLSQLQKRYKQRNPEVVGLAFETEKASNCP